MSNPTAPTANSRHTWTFVRAGGLDQVSLQTGADLRALDQLDQKLWVALSCPTRGLEFDARTLELIDTDKDGRIRAPEILEAVKWAGQHLKNLDDLLKGGTALALNAINDADASGAKLLVSARQILKNLGKPDAASITLDDTADTGRIFSQTQFNGDGIIPADSAADPETKQVIEDILTTAGSDVDRSGKPGITQARADAFFDELQKYSDWWQQTESSPAVIPLGESTGAAFESFKAVRAKAEDYFARCRLAAFDPRAAAPLNRTEADLALIAVKELTSTSDDIARLPLARVEAGQPLPLGDGVNPAWTAVLLAFNTTVVTPIFGAKKTSLTEDEWRLITAKFAPYETWLGAKPGGTSEKLGLSRIRQILASPTRAAIGRLIQQDLALQTEFDQISAVDRLIRYHHHLGQLLNNFVTFRDFYSRRDKAIFQAGTLYLDQRSCDLCLPVEDAGKHASLAGLAGTYLAYCDCVRKSTGEKIQIVAAFTDGDSDNLMAGRNGIFYDRKGRDWDATITKIVDNPISIRQAFWAPYKKFVRMMEEQIAKRAAAADAEAQKKVSDAAVATANLDKAKPAEPKKIDVGAVAALGVAFGAIGTALSALATGLLSLQYWQVPLVFVCLMLLISSPSMLIAWLKLRKRNLGPILDANGWAVNAKARINVPFGASLTSVAELPTGARRNLLDPYAEKKSPWPSIIVLVILLWLTYVTLDKWGYLSEWTDGRIGTPKVLIMPK
jgi:hypothetical protein